MLFVPMIQQKYRLIEVKSLGGAYTTFEKPKLNSKDWFEGKYQADIQFLLDQEVGFRNLLVRTYNQIYYSFFNQARANSVIVGKEDYLYDGSYINAYLGRDFVGERAVLDKVSKLQKISDTLRSLNIDLMVVFAPGKGSYYPEFIPDKFNPNRRTTTNHQAYTKAFSGSDIHFLDMNNWFVTQKARSKYPLFPKTGIHWSLYGEILAFDSIVKYVEAIRGVQLPKMKIGPVETPDTVRGTDDDVERGMNLLFDIPDLKMGYPALAFEEHETDIKLKVITVADSYYWGVFGQGISGRIFKDEQFWYYNKEIHSSSLPKSMLVEDINIRQEVEKRDLIVLLFTDSNLPSFAYGFIDQLYDLYFKPASDRK